MKSAQAESDASRDRQIMSNKQPMNRLTDFASSANAAILLSVLYPTLFAFSQNWYTASGREWVLLAALAFAFGLMIAVLYHVLTPFAAVLLSRVAGLDEETKARAIAQAILLAVACVVPFFLLLDGTFRDMLDGPRRVLALQIAVLAAAAWLFRAGHAAKYAAVLATASAASIVGFAPSYLLAARPGKAEIAKTQDFETATLKPKPNIYFFIYDAYGSEQVYTNNFGFDNSKHYAELEKRRFRVVHTLSNYANTWATTLSFFSGSHHYYAVNFRNDDTTSGRDVLNGNAHNPVIETLRQNGYRVQFVHASDYFAIDQGNLDIAYAAKPRLNVLRLYGSERLDNLIGLRDAVSWARRLDQQDNYLLERIPAITKTDAGPWFTFFWKPLPNHSEKRVFFTKQAGFATKFIEGTQLANERMLLVVDRIIRDDPKAIVVIIGDHGAWRYAGAAYMDPDPNKAFKQYGIAPQTATLDLFGVMIAIRSGGLCDDLVYPGLTPVNIMRVVFACLAERRDLLEGKADDISMFHVSNKLWLTGREGKVLPEWQALDAPK
jgi:hypothetical protein